MTGLTALTLYGGEEPQSGRAPLDWAAYRSFTIRACPRAARSAQRSPITCAGDSASECSLAATGEAGVRRLLSLWFADEHESLDNPIPEVSGRDAIDRWSAALAIAAVAAPSAFIDGMAGKGRSTTLLAILGDVVDLRATAILCEQVLDKDWLCRYNAVSSAGRRREPADRRCIERALGDPTLVVRSAAIKAVSRWDSERAVSLYEQLLARSAA